MKTVGSQTHPEFLHSRGDMAITGPWQWEDRESSRRQLGGHGLGVSDSVSLHLEVKMKCQDSQKMTKHEDELQGFSQ